jgi:hypothetical protein
MRCVVDGTTGAARVTVPTIRRSTAAIVSSVSATCGTPTVDVGRDCFRAAPAPNGTSSGTTAARGGVRWVVDRGVPGD